MLRLERGVRVDAGLIGSKATVLSFDALTLPLDATLGPSPFRSRGSTDAELTIPELLKAIDNPPPGTSYDQARTELHSRLVRTVSFLQLPLIAIPLGLTVRRSRRGVSLGVGIALLLVYHYTIQFGEGFAGKGKISPYLGLWLPFFLYLAAGFWAFHITATRPGVNPFTSVLSAIDGWFSRLLTSNRARRHAT